MNTVLRQEAHQLKEVVFNHVRLAPRVIAIVQLDTFQRLWISTDYLFEARFKHLIEDQNAHLVLLLHILFDKLKEELIDLKLEFRWDILDDLARL